MRVADYCLLSLSENGKCRLPSRHSLRQREPLSSIAHDIILSRVALYQSVTPVLKIAISWYPFFSLLVGVPFATSIT